jgi:glycosyltransferase involved in cell wall biosynthesis
MPDQIRVSLSVSVALCTYNGARFLREQLESIAAQTRLPDELVVCDDGSADESVEIVRSFAKNAPFPVRLELNEKNLGATKNFEKAIGLCEGDIIALSDQDDVWKPQKLAVLEKTLEEHPGAGYVFSDAELIDEAGILAGPRLWKSDRSRWLAVRSYSGGKQVAALIRRNPCTGATMAFRSTLKGVLLPISSYFVHDYWIALLASCVGAYGVPILEPLIQYRQHQGQQIGALRMSILDKVRWVRRVGPSEFSNRTRGYVDLRERLLGLTAEGRLYATSHMVLVQEKSLHLSRRAAAHSARGPAKLRKVLSEVFSGRYARYSNSWASVVEDLCF